MRHLPWPKEPELNPRDARLDKLLFVIRVLQVITLVSAALAFSGTAIVSVLRLYQLHAEFPWAW